MATIKRSRAPAAPAPSVTSRLGDILLNRRRTLVSARADRVEVQRKAGGLVAQMPEEVSPLSDVIRRAGSEGRPLRGTEYLHVSDLISRCIRKIALVEQTKMQRQPQRLSLMDLLTFAVGDTIHDVAKARAVVGAPSKVWGNWSCKCETTKTTTPCLFSEVDTSLRCPACKGALTTYTEVPIRDEELKIVGTPDLLMYLPDFDALYINELKSIAHAQFEELVRPKPEHVIQILFYWYLMRKAGYRVTNRVSLFYVTKGYKFTGEPYLEFSIDAESQVGRLDTYLELARELKQFRVTGELPARTMCASDRAPEARKCEVCNHCFGNITNAPIPVNISSALRRR